MMKHLCHAVDCAEEIAPKLFMCSKHWRMVPKKLQITIWNQYRPGQEIDKQPSLWYLTAQQFAVGEVAEQEGRMEEAQVAYRSSAAYAERAKDANEVLKGSL